MNNVKGIYHELLFVHAENVDGDEVMARVFEATNHKGADVEFIVEGDTIGQVQLKAVISRSAIVEHLGKYPNIKVIATEEVAATLPDVESSGFSNAEITNDVRDRLDDLMGDTFVEEIAEGIGSSALVAAAFAAGKAVRDKQVSRTQLTSALGDVVVGGITAVVLDALIDGVS